MSKQDDQFPPEQVDEQIETLAHLENSPALPEARLASDLHQVYEEEHEIAERVWVRLNKHIMQNSREHTEQKRPKNQALHMLVKEAQPMRTKATQQPPAKNRWHVLGTLAAILVVVALVGSMALLFQSRRSSQGSQGTVPPTAQVWKIATAAATPIPATLTPTPTTQASKVIIATATPMPATPTPTAQVPKVTPTTATPIPPTSVMLSLSASGIPPTTRSEITIPSGTIVTLTVIPDHSLIPFHTFTMGIYSTDPYGFSELQYCKYPNTGSCSYTIAYSSSEQTDYTKGTHTFKAFLGNTNGAILENSSGITVTWS